MREDRPAVTGERMAEIRSAGMWDSALTSDEFAAIRSVGFEPVGQVFGAAVYSAGSASGSSCPGTGGSSGDATQTRPAIYVSGQGGLGSLGPLVQAMNQARHTAIDRMTAECAVLGGHGVVGVRLSRGPFVLGGLEFSAIGTAVRAAGATHGPRAPFTCDLSGQDFAKLIMTGWIPAGLVLGISIGLRHDDRTTIRQARWRSGNAEIAGWTELIGQSRRDARDQLETDVGRLGAEGVVIAAMQLQVRERDCPVQVGRRDHIAEATLIGTAIARFSPAGQPGTGPALAIMSLDPQRRQAARLRLLLLRGAEAQCGPGVVDGHLTDGLHAMAGQDRDEPVTLATDVHALSMRRPCRRPHPTLDDVRAARPATAALIAYWTRSPATRSSTRWRGL